MIHDLICLGISNFPRKVFISNIFLPAVVLYNFEHMFLILQFISFTKWNILRFFNKLQLHPFQRFWKKIIQLLSEWCLGWRSLWVNAPVSVLSQCPSLVQIRRRVFVKKTQYPFVLHYFTALTMFVENCQLKIANFFCQSLWCKERKKSVSLDLKYFYIF